MVESVSEKKYRYSEIFGKTFQGEGTYTGRPTAWIRFWGCNFSCDGFGQKDPRDPTTWILDYQNLDPAAYKSMEELPVFHRGCDSSYSWSQKFSHLAHKGTAAEICERIEEVLPHGKFLHPVSNQHHHMAFTGGEPMMSQTAIVDIMDTFLKRNNVPKFVTIETNGTQAPRPAFQSLFRTFPFNETEVFWSVSPKLSASGEKWEKAILPSVVSQYKEVSDRGHLKFVCDGSDACWDEVERATDAYREAGINWDVWIMPVGADREMQESHQAHEQSWVRWFGSQEEFSFLVNILMLLGISLTGEEE